MNQLSLPNNHAGIFIIALVGFYERWISGTAEEATDALKAARAAHVNMGPTAVAALVEDLERLARECGLVEIEQDGTT